MKRTITRLQQNITGISFSVWIFYQRCLLETTVHQKTHIQLASEKKTHKQNYLTCLPSAPGLLGNTQCLHEFKEQHTVHSILAYKHNNTFWCTLDVWFLCLFFFFKFTRITGVCRYPAAYWTIEKSYIWMWKNIYIYIDRVSNGSCESCDCRKKQKGIDIIKKLYSIQWMFWYPKVITLHFNTLTLKY